MLVPILENFVGAELEWDRRLDTLGRLAWLHIVAVREWRHFGLGNDEAFYLSIPSATLRSSSSSVLVSYELEGEIALPVAALQQDRESHTVAQIVGH
ncbi:hypothetical protein ACHMZP_34030 [Rhodococcus baikonurensis]|uniref:hypothetical protein n=1 Tax=Rhodococcus baikonurensis TaxID=172041 RepID=UPI003793CF7A